MIEANQGLNYLNFCLVYIVTEFESNLSFELSLAVMFKFDSLIFIRILSCYKLG